MTRNKTSPLKLTPTKVRVQKLIAERTPLSRRAAETAIQAGRVHINSLLLTELGTTITPDVDRVSLDGIVLRRNPPKVYIMYNKPKNRIVSKKDPQGRETIWSDLKRWEGIVDPAGRLDYDTEGLIILSNDGDFVNRMTHPKFEMVKTYQAKVKDVPHPTTIERLSKGVLIEGQRTKEAVVTVLKQEGRHTWIELAIHEGRYHQVKQMCEAVHHPVIKLRRIAIGPIRLGALPRGKWRFLKKQELKRLGVDAADE